ncbi:beta-N-acetylhexosaminidase [Thalassotalea sp. PLHSN55]|uniref:beta-N-acetylhexosaminidase n=1 Tax=Thalassotalea sp. PLHSN55 TaxID=3435888 RepID=UPI003F82E154
MGPIMLDVQGTSLTQEDKEILAHPLVGGLILFTRNYHSPAQVAQLTKDIRQASRSDILIAVDHEGGRVQRFREGFSAIPAMGSLLAYADNDLAHAQELSRQCGILMALEVQAVGIDISFAPVLDIDDISDVIGDRSFSKNPAIVTPLASAFIDGMRSVGMQATGKHFPGHGSVKADSHFDLPIDDRSQADILTTDILPFKDLIAQQKLAAIMPAHIIFPAFDPHAVGFSPFWLQQVLRQQLRFDGVIFSDDLSMEGARAGGDFIERSEMAQQAGCDMLLLCNNRTAAVQVIDNANLKMSKQSELRLKKMLNPSRHSWQELARHAIWQQANNIISQLK